MGCDRHPKVAKVLVEGEVIGDSFVPRAVFVITNTSEPMTGFIRTTSVIGWDNA